jgi:Rieske Fe-S protein
MSNKEKEIVRKDRRSFLSFLPLGILGVVGASLTIAAERSLGPQAVPTADESWKTLGEVGEIAGEGPIEKTITVTCRSGWSKTEEDVSVFVLPKHDNKVLSSVCPHEGCPIVWDDDSSRFLCPCHDSYFSDEGRKLTGPAAKDLTEYETRVRDGKLQIKV